MKSQYLNQVKKFTWISKSDIILKTGWLIKEWGQCRRVSHASHDTSLSSAWAKKALLGRRVVWAQTQRADSSPFTRGCYRDNCENCWDEACAMHIRSYGRTLTLELGHERQQHDHPLAILLPTSSWALSLSVDPTLTARRIGRGLV